MKWAIVLGLLGIAFAFGSWAEGLLRLPRVQPPELFLGTRVELIGMTTNGHDATEYDFVFWSTWRRWGNR